jgi:WD40 repeat protein
LEGYQRTILKMAFSPDSRRLASAGNDDSVRVLMAAPFLSATVAVPALAVYDTATARVWDVTTGQEVFWRQAPPGIVDLGFSSDGRRLSCVAADGTLRTWSGE